MKTTSNKHLTIDLSDVRDSIMRKEYNEDVGWDLRDEVLAIVEAVRELAEHAHWTDAARVCRTPEESWRRSELLVAIETTNLNEISTSTLELIAGALKAELDGRTTR
jgi:hypothetical protein